MRPYSLACRHKLWKNYRIQQRLTFEWACANQLLRCLYVTSSTKTSRSVVTAASTILIFLKGIVTQARLFGTQLTAFFISSILLMSMCLSASAQTTPTPANTSTGAPAGLTTATPVVAPAALIVIERFIKPEQINTGDTAWLLASTALVMMMTLPGLAFFYAGLVRKNYFVNDDARIHCRSRCHGSLVHHRLSAGFFKRQRLTGQYQRQGHVCV